MTTDPEPFDSERSRAAVALACLEWLRCTGPVVPPTPPRTLSPDIAEILRNPIPIVNPAHHFDPPEPGRHPLWDRWIDG